MEYLGTIRLNWKYRQILAEQKKKENKKEKGVNLFQFCLSIEF